MARTKRLPRNRSLLVFDIGNWRIVENTLNPEEEITATVTSTICNSEKDEMITFTFAEPGNHSMTINRSLLAATQGPLKALVSAPFKESQTGIVRLDDPYASFCLIRNYLYGCPVDFSGVRDDFCLAADKWQLDTLLKAFFLVKVDQEWNDNFCWFGFRAMRFVGVPQLVRHVCALRFVLLFEIGNLDISDCINRAGFNDLRHMLEVTKTGEVVREYAGMLCSKESVSLSLSTQDLKSLNFKSEREGVGDNVDCHRMIIWCKKLANTELYHKEQTFPYGRDGLKEIRITQTCFINCRSHGSDTSLNLVICGIPGDDIDTKRNTMDRKDVLFRVRAVEDGCCCEFLDRNTDKFEKFEPGVEQSGWVSFVELIGGVRVVAKKEMARWTSEHYERCGLYLVVDMFVKRFS